MNLATPFDFSSSASSFQRQKVQTFGYPRLRQRLWLTVSSKSLVGWRADWQLAHLAGKKDAHLNASRIFKVFKCPIVSLTISECQGARSFNEPGKTLNGLPRPLRPLTPRVWHCDLAQCLYYSAVNERTFGEHCVFPMGRTCSARLSRQQLPFKRSKFTGASASMLWRPAQCWGASPS